MCVCESNGELCIVREGGWEGRGMKNLEYSKGKSKRGSPHYKKQPDQPTNKETKQKEKENKAPNNDRFKTSICS